MADELLCQPSSKQLYYHPTSKQLIYKVNVTDTCPTDVSGWSNAHLVTTHDPLDVTADWEYNGNTFVNNAPAVEFLEITDVDGSNITCSGGVWTMTLKRKSDGHVRAVFTAPADATALVDLVWTAVSWDSDPLYPPTAQFNP